VCVRQGRERKGTRKKGINTHRGNIIIGGGRVEQDVELGVGVGGYSKRTDRQTDRHTDSSVRASVSLKSKRALRFVARSAQSASVRTIVKKATRELDVILQPEIITTLSTSKPRRGQSPWRRAPASIYLEC
jgi:hypothetical protein